MAGHLVKYGKHRVRRSYSRIKEVLDLPNLIEIQTDSYKWFLDEGLREMFDDIMPIEDFQGNLSLEFVDYQLLTMYLDATKFDERFKYIQIITQKFIANEAIDDFNEFIEMITNTKRFARNIVVHYKEHIYQYVADNYCNSTFDYEEEYARYKIEDTKELAKIIQLIAEYEEEYEEK